MEQSSIIAWAKEYIEPRRYVGPPWYDEFLMRFSSEVGGEFVQESNRFGMRRSPQVLVHVKPWIIRFDVHEMTLPGGLEAASTRARASYESKKPFEFKIYRHGYFSKLIAVQEFGTGYPEFDRAFVIQPHGEPRAQAVVENPKIRKLIHSVLVNSNCPMLKAEKHGWWSRYQTLYYEEGEIITDIARLKSILDLFAEMLNHLCHIGLAT